jgi:GntR family transcriptional regulator, arabinose operon transcriptional repressor
MKSDQTSHQEPHKKGRLHRDIEARIRLYADQHDLKPGARLPTETDFCKLFKVSRSTVRHALELLEKDGLVNRTRGRGTFLSDPALAVAARAQQREQRDDAQASPRPGRNTVGVMLTYSTEIDVMQTAILRGVEHAVKSRGYNLLSARTDDWDELREARAIDELCQHGVGGIIVMPTSNHTTTRGVEGLVAAAVPLVLVDRYFSDLPTSYVVSDNFGGMYHATEYLICLGYRTFGFVLGAAGGPVCDQIKTTSMRDRYDGYGTALRDYGLASAVADPLLVDLHSRVHVQETLVKIIAAASAAFPGMPPAIVAVHDMVAVEFARSAVQAGLKPPDDFALIGFDDLPIAGHLAIPLTSVTQPRYEIGFRAGHLLIDKLEGHPVRSDQIALPVSLVVRESCGAKQIIRRRLAI